MARPIANPPVTFDPADPIFQKAVADAVAVRLAMEKGAKAEKAKATTSDQYTSMTVAAFKRKGFKDIQPRVNTLTFNRWLEKGYRPKEGEKAVAVKGLRLFHISQVRPLAATDADMIAAKAAKGVPVARTADRLPPVSPITAKPAKGKPAPAQPTA